MKVDIKSKLDLLCQKEQNITESEIVHIMVLVRKHLDYPDMEMDKKFLTLKFFCDWSLHITIEYSIPAMQILVKLNDTIVRLKQTPNNDLLMKEITKVVSFPMLKDQLHKFLSSIGIDDKLTTITDNWLNFLEKYIEIIRDQVIAFPEDMSPRNRSFRMLKPYYDQITSNPIKEGCWTIGLSLSLINESFFKAESIPSRNSLFCLILYASDTTRVVIPITKQDLL